MKKFVAIFVSTIILVSAFCFSVGAEPVSFPVSNITAGDYQIYSDMYWTTDFVPTDSSASVNSTEFTVAQWAQSNTKIRSAMVEFVPKSGTFFTLNAGEVVTFNFRIRYYNWTAASSYNPLFKCELVGSNGKTLLATKDYATTSGASWIQITSTYINPSTSSTIVDCTKIRAYVNQDVTSSLAEISIFDVTVDIYSEADAIVDGLSNKIDSLPQYQDNFTGNHDMGGDSLNNAEQNNLNAAASGLDGATGFFNGMLDNISAYASSFSVISLLMTKLFAEVPALYALVHFSIGLGLFAILLGVVSAVFRRRGGGKSDSGG